MSNWAIQTSRPPHHQQGDRDEELLQAAGRDDAIQRPQHLAPDQYRRRNDRRRLYRGDGNRADQRRTGRPEQRQQGEQGYDCEILKQQHRERYAAVAGNHLATLHQNLDDKRRGRQSEAAADHHRDFEYNRVALHAVCRETLFWEHLEPRLRSAVR